MPAWPRTLLPKATSPFHMPGAEQSWGQSGKDQHRSTTQIGRVWSETYDLFQGNSIAGREILAFINNCWRNGLVFTTDHQLFLTPNGSGTGSPQVNGASQTGSTLSTKLWTGSDPVLRAGDIFRITGISNIFDVTANAPNLAAGITALSINPPIFAGGSPANNAAITYAAVPINAFIYQEPAIPDAGANGWIAGMRIIFREDV